MKYWNRLPVWARKTIMGALETSAIAYLVYFIGVLEGKMTFDTYMVVLIALKAILQAFRTNPDIPINDYVNNQK